MTVSPSAVSIDLSRDETLSDFTLQTLKERYLVGDEKSPQEAFARASAAFADDAAHAQRLYDYVSKGWFMFATPLLSNGGTTRGLPISCFLTAVEDSRESISDHYDEMIWLSSMGGGIGSYWGGLRSAGEKTSKGSQSTGVMPFMAVDDRLILAVSQGGTRRGSNAVYLDIDHPEVEEFMVARKATGGDRNRKIENLHNAVNVTDEFMRAVRDGTTFGLRSPKTREVLKWVDARGLWQLLLETRMQTGEPYLHFVDQSNRMMPEAQKALGLKVNQSNLCVTGETEVLTRNGHMPIAALAGSEHDVWNGEAWSRVLLEKTGEQQDLVRVWFEDGDFLDTTLYHKFYDAEGTLIRAGELRPGQVLETTLMPSAIQGFCSPTAEQAYTAGWATMAGFEDRNRLAVAIPNTHPDACFKRLFAHSVDAEATDYVTTVRYETTTIGAGHVPFEYDFSGRKMWLAGALDAAADWIEVDGIQYLSLGSTDRDLIRDMRRLALEVGLHPRVRLTDTLNAFMIPAYDAAVHFLGILTARHYAATIPTHKPSNSPVVADVHPLPWKADVYCGAEPLRGRITFNGYLTGNCTEITLATGRDHLGKKRTAVCCLSSVNGEKFDEWCHEPLFIEDLMRMLDNALQVFIVDAPAELAHAVYSATQERSVGLGLLGFQAYLQKHDIPFESEGARMVNIDIFRHLRAGADAASLKLGAERGEAPDMAGTGERFAHKLAIAPNASSSILCGGTSPSVEPHRANAYLHKTLSGSFPVRNVYLKAKLASLGIDTDEVWKAIIANEGSILGLDVNPVDEDGHAQPSVFDELGIVVAMPGEVVDEDAIVIPHAVWEHVKAVFKTAMELDQRWIVQLARDRQGSICQAQSINTFMPGDGSIDAEYLSEVHYMAWDPDGEGTPLKSLYYLRSTTPKRAENTNAKVERKIIAEVSDEDAQAALSPTADSDCVACEG